MMRTFQSFSALNLSQKLIHLQFIKYNQMLNRISKSCTSLAKTFSTNILTKLSYVHSQITKQLGFTPTFEKAIKQKLQKKQKDSFLRLEIFAGQGCEGFTYKFKFDNLLKETDFVYKLKFDQNQDPRIVFAANGQEMKLLKGATIDYAQEMMRQIFYVKENPNAQISCSCKSSFSPKDYVL